MHSRVRRWRQTGRTLPARWPGDTQLEDVMRILFALLALIGVAGVALGLLRVIGSSGGPTGILPFSHEAAGGPGVILGGVFLLAGSLYLLSTGRAHRE
jgi:hypothetical protein